MNTRCVSAAKKILPLIFLSTLALTFAHAAPVTSINVQTFNPSTSDHFVLIEDAYRSDWPRNSNVYFGMNYNYVSEPFVALDSVTQQRAFTVVNSIQTVDLMVGFKASARFGLFFGMPFHFVNLADVNQPAIGFVQPAASTTGMGDMKILGKIRISGDDALATFTLIPEIHLPTGNTQYFVSDASTYLGLRFAIERQFQNFTLLGNLGFAAASSSIYSTTTSTIDFRKRLLFGIGGFMPFNDRWGMNLEFNSENMLPFDSNINPNELYAGARYAMNPSWIGTLGASLGKIGGPSGQNFRIIAGLRFNISDEVPSAPIPPTFVPAPTPIAAPRVVMKAKQIELSTPVNFKEDSSLLTQDGKELLDEVADVMSKNTASYKKILIDGHTNNNGKAPHNLWLSLERAKSVKHYLVGKGIPVTVLEARGFGQSKPKVPYSNPKAMDINRRVEFNIVQ